jgi:hypothetical protein
MDNRPLSGDSEWLRQAVVLDLPAASVGVAFGVLLAGPGDVWIDDVVLEVVGRDVTPTKALMPPMTMPSDSATVVASYAARPTAPRNPGFEER